MRKLMFVAAAAAVLTTAGLAVANGGQGTKTAKAVTGTFAATTATSTQTTTCTSTDGKSIAVSKARYTGTAAGDADLAGPITIDARSTINTTDGVGVVTGKLRIDVASGEDTTAQFDAVYDHGTVVGLASGHVQDPHAKLLANVSAGFSAAGGFTGGKIGGAAGGAAVELGPAKCASAQAAKEKSEAEGKVTALSATSITVAGLTCALAGDLGTKVNAALKVGDRAEIRCRLVNGTNTLVSFEKERD